MTSDISLEILDRNNSGINRFLPELAVLFQDAIDSGASMGPLKPLSTENAVSFWENVENDLDNGEVKLILALTPDGRVAGSAQLGYPGRENSHIRADVMKVMVHRDFRGQGLGRRIMEALDRIAREDGKETLVLDVLEGADAEFLYQKCGYQKVGAIPDYVVDEIGQRLATVYYFKSLR